MSDRKKELRKMVEYQENKIENLRREATDLVTRLDKARRDVSAADSRTDSLRRELTQEIQRLYGVMALIPDPVLSEAIGKYQLQELRQSRPESS